MVHTAPNACWLAPYMFTSSRLLVLCFGAMALIGSAHASLGGNASAVPSEISRAGGHLREQRSVSTQSATYRVHSYTDAQGTLIKQFENSNGVVFAITWNGARRPNLAQLLGESSFARYAAKSASQASPSLHRQPADVQDSDLIIHSGGHMGHSWGTAYLPNELPAGVSANDLH